MKAILTKRASVHTICTAEYKPLNGSFREHHRYSCLLLKNDSSLCKEIDAYPTTQWNENPLARKRDIAFLSIRKARTPIRKGQRFDEGTIHSLLLLQFRKLSYLWWTYGGAIYSSRKKDHKWIVNGVQYCRYKISSKQNTVMRYMLLLLCEEECPKLTHSAPQRIQKSSF